MFIFFNKHVLFYDQKGGEIHFKSSHNDVDKGGGNRINWVINGRNGKREREGEGVVERNEGGEKEERYDTKREGGQEGGS